MAEEKADIFLSCFKCGRIVRAGDSECPRCGLQFGPGTLFECPFCSGLVWRNASKCSTCGIDLTEFSIGVEKTFAGFDMDEFVENIINTELEALKSSSRKVACPGCGLMIRGDEEKCPRCDLPLEEASVECPVCGEKMPIRAKSCPNCGAEFEEKERGDVMLETSASEALSDAPVSPRSTSKKAASRSKAKKPARKPSKKPTKAKKGGAKPRKSTGAKSSTKKKSSSTRKKSSARSKK